MWSQNGVKWTLCVRYWDDKTNQVSTRYSTSSFMGHNSAEDVLSAFKDGISELPLHSIIQVSMDGPNVNWSFLKMFNAYLQTNCDEKTLINLGSCGLHVVHGSLKTGHSAAKWSVHQILRSMYNLFKASPARRSDLCAIKPDTKFPLKFCKVRWCGNTPVCTRAIEVFWCDTFDVILFYIAGCPVIFGFGLEHHTLYDCGHPYVCLYVWNKTSPPPSMICFPIALW